MNVNIRRMRPDEAGLLREFLYQAIYRWIYRNCGSIPKTSAHGPGISAL